MPRLNSLLRPHLGWDAQSVLPFLFSGEELVQTMVRKWCLFSPRLPENLIGKKRTHHASLEVLLGARLSGWTMDYNYIRVHFLERRYPYETTLNPSTRALIRQQGPPRSDLETSTSRDARRGSSLHFSPTTTRRLRRMRKVRLVGGCRAEGNIPSEWPKPKPQTEFCQEVMEGLFQSIKAARKTLLIPSSMLIGPKGSWV